MVSNAGTPFAFRSDGATRRLLLFGILSIGICLEFGISGFGICRAADEFPRPPADILEAQIALARRNISSGSIDGKYGGQTRLALVAFQEDEALDATGTLDNATRDALTLAAPPLTTRAFTA